MQNSQHLLMKGVWKENFKKSLDICNLSDCEKDLTLSMRMCILYMLLVDIFQEGYIPNWE